MIDSIDFEGNNVKLGKLTVLVGPNGAGKTRLLRAICSKHEPFGRVIAGRVLYAEDGHSVIDNWRLSNPEAHGMLLIDAISDCLHMTNQVITMRKLQAILMANQNMQAVVVTNSPFQLETVAIEDVRVVARRGNVVKIKSLAEHPELDRWRAGMDTGELWANLGEDWVFE